MDFGKYVDLELGLQLKEKGFDEMCGYTFVNHRRVRDEIKTKYPGLSDCGYDELTQKWGGELEEDEVYGQYTDPYQENVKNSWIEPDEKMRLCAMPTLDDARRWLRKQHMDGWHDVTGRVTEAAVHELNANRMTVQCKIDGEVQMPKEVNPFYRKLYQGAVAAGTTDQFVRQLAHSSFKDELMQEQTQQQSKGFKR